MTGGKHVHVLASDVKLMTTSWSHASDGCLRPTESPEKGEGEKLGRHHHLPITTLSQQKRHRKAEEADILHNEK
jgi:hypothetical protein